MHIPQDTVKGASSRVRVYSETADIQLLATGPEKIWAGWRSIRFLQMSGTYLLRLNGLVFEKRKGKLMERKLPLGIQRGNLELNIYVNKKNKYNGKYFFYL